jgi:chromosome segregation ATPase
MAATLATGGIAIWQTRELGARDSIIAELRNFLTEADQAAGVARLEKHALEIELQKARAERDDVERRVAHEALSAELAAVRQQLSAAETAMVETEDRLADEISAHADLKRKADQLADQVAAAAREIEAAEAKVERAQAELAKLQALAAAAPVVPESAPPAVSTANSPAANTTVLDPIGATGSLPDAKSESRIIKPAATRAPAAAPSGQRKAIVKKPRPRQIAKPAIKAVKPEGGIFEPLLEPQL